MTEYALRKASSAAAVLGLLLTPSLTYAGTFSDSTSGWYKLAGMLSNMPATIDVGAYIGDYWGNLLTPWVWPIMFFLFLLSLGLTTIGKSLGLKAEPLHVVYSLAFGVFLLIPVPFNISTNTTAFTQSILQTAYNESGVSKSVLRPKILGATGTLDAPLGLAIPYTLASAIFKSLVDAGNKITQLSTVDGGVPTTVFAALNSSYATSFKAAPDLQSAIYNYVHLCTRAAEGHSNLDNQFQKLGLLGGTKLGNATAAARRSREADASQALQILQTTSFTGSSVQQPDSTYVVYAIPNASFWLAKLGNSGATCNTDRNGYQDGFMPTGGPNGGPACNSQMSGEFPFTTNAHDFVQGITNSKSQNHLSSAQMSANKSGDVVYLAPMNCKGLYETVDFGENQFKQAYLMHNTYANAGATAAGDIVGGATSGLGGSGALSLVARGASTGAVGLIGGAATAAILSIYEMTGGAALSKAYYASYTNSVHKTPTNSGSWFTDAKDYVTGWFGSAAQHLRAFYNGAVTGVSNTLNDYHLQTDVPLYIGTIALAMALLFAIYPLFVASAVLPGRLGTLKLPYMVLAWVFTGAFLNFISMELGGMMAIALIHITSASSDMSVNFLKTLAPLATNVETGIHVMFFGSYIASYFLITATANSLRDISRSPSLNTEERNVSKGERMALTAGGAASVVAPAALKAASKTASIAGTGAAMGIAGSINSIDRFMKRNNSPAPHSGTKSQEMADRAAYAGKAGRAPLYQRASQLKRASQDKTVSEDWNDKAE